MIDTLVDAARSPEFLAGLAPGAAALLLGVFLGAAAWAGGRRVVVPAGILAACAALVGLRQIMTVPPGLVVGLGLLAAAGGTARALGLSPAVAVGALVPGALVVAYRAELEPIAWMQALVVGGVVGGAALTGAFDQRWRQSGAPPVMLAVTAVGVWATVPEVSHALVLVGATLPLAALGRPFPLAGLGAGGSAAVVGLVAWTAATGGWYRGSAVVGAVSSLGLFVVEPVARWRWAPAGSPRRGWRECMVLVAAHGAVVVAMSRVAGLQRSLTAAVIVAVATAGVALAGARRLDVLARQGG